MSDDAFLVRKAIGRHAASVDNHVIFKTLDDALIDFDKKAVVYGSGWTVKPVIVAFQFGVAGGRKVNAEERHAAQKRLGLRVI